MAEIRQPIRHRLEPANPGYIHSIAPHIPTDPAEREAFWALAWLEQNHGAVLTTTGVGLETFGLLTGPGNTALIQQVGTAHDQYRRGQLTKGQYDYRRRQALKTFTQKVGPAERLLLKGQNANEAIRISRLKGIPATQKIDAAAARLSKLSKYATRGGVLLAGAGLYAGCRQIAQTSNRTEKNQIMIETISGTAIGMVTSFVIGAVLIATPIGWGVALAIAAGSAATGYLSGQGLRYAYDRWGNQVDLLEITQIDALCN